MPNTKKLKLYRGIYTDEHHADIIRNNGLESKWFIATRGYYKFNKTNIDDFFNRESLQRDDVEDGLTTQPILYAAGTKEDACFYALRNKNDGFLFSQEKALKEQYFGEKKLFVITFEVPLEEVYIDPIDSLYPLSYCADRWSEMPDVFESVCKIWGEKTVKKYLPKMLDKKNYDCNALVPLFTAEEDAIRSFYNNHTIRIHGKRRVELFSSFRMFGADTHTHVLKVEEISEKQCKEVLLGLKGFKYINIWY